MFYIINSIFRRVYGLTFGCWRLRRKNMLASYTVIWLKIRNFFFFFSLIFGFFFSFFRNAVETTTRATMRHYTSIWYNTALNALYQVLCCFSKPFLSHKRSLLSWEKTRFFVNFECVWCHHASLQTQWKEMIKSHDKKSEDMVWYYNLPNFGFVSSTGSHGKNEKPRGFRGTEKVNYLLLLF